jgi:hypothetical protein
VRQAADVAQRRRHFEAHSVIEAQLDPSDTRGARETQVSIAAEDYAQSPGDHSFPARATFRPLAPARDGATYAPSRVYWCLAALTQISLSIWHTVVAGKDFSSTDFGTGMGLVLTAGGLGVWITRKTEPS